MGHKSDLRDTEIQNLRWQVEQLSQCVECLECPNHHKDFNDDSEDGEFVNPFHSRSLVRETTTYGML